jgi:hypothetical protein
MKKPVVSLVVSLIVAAGFAGSGIVAGQEYQTPSTKDVTLTGCLVQGSGPTVFILENAKTNPADTSQKGRNYLLSSGVASVSFQEHLNNEVRVEGKAEIKDPPAQPSGMRINESELPKLKAMKITHVASTCSPPLS